MRAEVRDAGGSRAVGVATYALEQHARHRAHAGAPSATVLAVRLERDRSATCDLWDLALEGEAGKARVVKVVFRGTR
jgi:hypothetical protein